jgi:hypothetical protein
MNGPELNAGYLFSQNNNLDQIKTKIIKQPMIHGYGAFINVFTHKFGIK